MFKLRKVEWLLVLVIAVILAVGGVWLSSNIKEAKAQGGILDIAKAYGYVNYVGYQSISPTSSTASSLTQTSMSTNTVVAYITCETATVRYRFDGTNPTKTEGHAIASGENITLKGRNQINKFRAISAAAHGTLKISYGE